MGFCSSMQKESVVVSLSFPSNGIHYLRLLTTVWVFHCASMVSVSAQALAQDTTPTAESQLEPIVIGAFNTHHDGYSVDEVLIDQRLREPFVKAVKAESTRSSEKSILESLLRARKSGKLTARANKRGARADDRFRFAAEISARLVCDQHHVSTDALLTDPDLRQQLLVEARKLTATATEYDVLKLVLALRKARQLRPELVLQAVDWPREIIVVTGEQITKQLDSIPPQPGIYIFRDQDGYLYIGQAQNLQNRLQQHFNESHSAELTSYLNSQANEALTIELHVFPKDSPAAKVGPRRAYESELIRSRQPRLNVLP